ncbi:MAG TPA: VWA domain-containing protein [Candidatus Sulfotelmatobacter sp.]
MKRSLVLLLVVAGSLPAFSQSPLDSVHIASREAVALPSFSSSGLTAGLQVIKKDVNLVLVPVSVTDPLQRMVTGLHLDNFQVFEGKKAQEIRNFSSEDSPVSVGIILDSSGSMHDKMERVREAVHQFCNAANVEDEFFLITFSDVPRLVTDFTRDPSKIENELLFTHAKGRTALLDAIHMGVRKMKEASYARRALLIISDGGDNHSRYSEHDIKSAVKETDVVIYAIGTFDHYMPTAEEMAGPTLLSEIAEPTGGRAFTITNPVELPEVAHLIGAELRNQYVLGYRPEDVPHDGKWHKINVRLKLPKQLSFLRVHARSGYYAAAR